MGTLLSEGGYDTPGMHLMHEFFSAKDGSAPNLQLASRPSSEGDDDDDDNDDEDIGPVDNLGLILVNIMLISHSCALGWFAGSSTWGSIWHYYSLWRELGTAKFA